MDGSRRGSRKEEDSSLHARGWRDGGERARAIGSTKDEDEGRGPRQKRDEILFGRRASWGWPGAGGRAWVCWTGRGKVLQSVQGSLRNSGLRVQAQVQGMVVQAQAHIAKSVRREQRLEPTGEHELNTPRSLY